MCLTHAQTPILAGAITSENLTRKLLKSCDDHLPAIKKTAKQGYFPSANCWFKFFPCPGLLFSLSRSGSQLSFFGANASIWPDLYSSCVANLGEQKFSEKTWNFLLISKRIITSVLYQVNTNWITYSCQCPPECLTRSCRTRQALHFHLFWWVISIPKPCCNK